MPEPIVLFGAEGVSRLESTLAHPRVVTSWRAFLAQARADAAAPALAVPGPEATGEWGAISAFVGPTAASLERLAFARLLTRERAFAAPCLERVEALLAAPAWVDSCHSFSGRRFDLGAGHVTRALALAADWLGDELPSALRARVESALRERAVEAFLADTSIASNWWLIHQVNNWVPVMCAGLASMAVAFREAIGPWRELFARALHETGRYLRWVFPDGSVEEAGGYWAYGISNALVVADLARRHAGEDWYGMPQLRRTGYFPLYTSVRGEHVLDFGDTTRGKLLGAPSLRLAAEYRDGCLQWHGELGTTADLLSLIWWDPEVEPRAPEHLPASTSWPGGVEWAVLRSSLTDPDAVVAGLRGGTNVASHCHRDLNSIIVHAFGEPLVADHGNLGYSREYWTNQYGHLGRDTRGHNTLVPKGMEQLQRRTIPTMTQGEDLRCRSRIAAFVAAPEASYAAAEAVLTYGEGERGRRVLVSHDRHLALLRPDLLLLVDEVSSGEPLEFEWLFHAGAEVAVEPGGALFARRGARLRLRFHGPEAHGLREERRADQNLPYVAVAAAGARVRATLVATLLPFRAGEGIEPPEVEVRGRVVDVAWRGGRRRLDVAARRLL